MKAIVKEEPTMPGSLSVESQDFMRRLLAKDPADRLAGDAVLRHSWFSGIDWTALRAQKLEAPYLPVLSHDEDTRCFDEVRTWIRATLIVV
jgi:serine/threonine protein kinase